MVASAAADALAALRQAGDPRCPLAPPSTAQSKRRPFQPSNHHCHILRLQEVERLAKMAADKSVAPAKREAFEWKANILGGFLPAGKGSGKGGGSGGKKTEL